jgi:hypothetical protein
MKKLILALALVATFIACSGPTEEATAPIVDTTVVAVDTTVAVAPVVDSTAVDSPSVAK